jgi:hypothetical protein
MDSTKATRTGILDHLGIRFLMKEGVFEKRPNFLKQRANQHRQRAPERT